MHVFSCVVWFVGTQFSNQTDMSAATATTAPATAAPAAGDKKDVKDSKDAKDTKSDEKNEKVTSYPKNKIKILLLEGISQTATDMLVKEGFQVESVYKISESDLIKKLPDFHALGIRSKTQLTAKVLAAAKKLLTIGCFCIGTDQTDLDFAAKAGIAVFNVCRVCSRLSLVVINR